MRLHPVQDHLAIGMLFAHRRPDRHGSHDEVRCLRRNIALQAGTASRIVDLTHLKGHASYVRNDLAHGYRIVANAAVRAIDFSHGGSRYNQTIEQFVTRYSPTKPSPVGYVGKQPPPQSVQVADVPTISQLPPSLYLHRVDDEAQSLPELPERLLDGSPSEDSELPDELSEDEFEPSELADSELLGESLLVGESLEPEDDMESLPDELLEELSDDPLDDSDGEQQLQRNSPSKPGSNPVVPQLPPPEQFI